MKRLNIVLLVVNLCLLGCGCKSRYVVKGEEELQSILEQEFPVGMKKEDVRARLDEMSAEITQDRATGFRTRDNESMCASHFRAELHSYHLPLHTTVEVYIGFGREDRVCRVEVRKSTDAF